MYGILRDAGLLVARYRDVHLRHPTVVYLTQDQINVCVAGFNDAYGQGEKAVGLTRLMDMEVRCDPQGMRVA